MCVVDFNPPVFHSETWRRARKEHECVECSRPLTKGTRYLHISAMWDRGSTPTQLRRCELCAEIADAVEAVECSWLYESLLDDAAQALNPLGEHTGADPAAIGKLIGLMFRVREEQKAWLNVNLGSAA